VITYVLFALVMNTLHISLVMVCQQRLHLSRLCSVRWYNDIEWQTGKNMEGSIRSL